MARVQWRVVRLLPRSGTGVARFGKRKKIICDFTVQYDRSVYCGREEGTELLLLSKLLRPDQTFVDCGANIGLYTVFGADLVGPTGRVIAIEPVASTFARLRDNVALNNFENRVRLFNNALSDEPGILVSLTGNEHNVMRVDPYSPGDHVATAVLDEILAHEPSVTGIKLDVEGYEAHVLRGASAVLTRCAPWIFVELNSEIASTRVLEDWDVHTMLSSYEYTAHLPRALLARDYTPLPDHWVNPQSYINLAYLPNSQQS
jgi:FkbM family methyltransferase